MALYYGSRATFSTTKGVGIYRRPYLRAYMVPCTLGYAVYSEVDNSNSVYNVSEARTRVSTQTDSVTTIRAIAGSARSHIIGYIQKGIWDTVGYLRPGYL